MANADKLQRARNEVSRMEQHIEDSKKRFKELQQRLLKLEEQDFIKTVREAGFTPEQLREVVNLYNKERILHRIDAADQNGSPDWEDKETYEYSGS